MLFVIYPNTLGKVGLILERLRQDIISFVDKSIQAGKIDWMSVLNLSEQPEQCSTDATGLVRPT